MSLTTLLHKTSVLRPLKGYRNIAKPGRKRRENVYKQGDSRAVSDRLGVFNIHISGPDLYTNLTFE